MRISTKLSIALHLLVVISVYDNKKKLTSEVLGKSTGSNAVIVRNLLGQLKKAGLVSVPRGIGGAALLKDPQDISLWDVYSAVEEIPISGLIGLHPHPSQTCSIGQTIYDVLATPYDEIGLAMQQKMQEIPLSRIIDDYYAKLNEQISTVSF